MVKEIRHHPLDPLSAKEVVAAVRIFRTHGPASDNIALRFDQPARTDQDELERVSAGDNILDRCAFDYRPRFGAPRVLEVIVSLRDETLLSYEERRGVQPGIIIEEFILCENAVKADPRWRAALIAPRYHRIR